MLINKLCFKVWASEVSEEKNLYFYRVSDILMWKVEIVGQL